MLAKRGGTVLSVTAEQILIEPDAGTPGELDTYRLERFVRSNQGTCINQRPIVDVGCARRGKGRCSPTAVPRTTVSWHWAATSWSRS